MSKFLKKHNLDRIGNSSCRKPEQLGSPWQGSNLNQQMPQFTVGVCITNATPQIPTRADSVSHLIQSSNPNPLRGIYSFIADIPSTWIFLGVKSIKLPSSSSENTACLPFEGFDDMFKTKPY